MSLILCFESFFIWFRSSKVPFLVISSHSVFFMSPSVLGEDFEFSNFPYFSQ